MWISEIRRQGELHQLQEQIRPLKEHFTLYMNIFPFVGKQLYQVQYRSFLY
jgi:hypothetical protein